MDEQKMAKRQAPKAEPTPNDASSKRRKRVEELRQAYLDGTIDDMLIPAETDAIDNLVTILFPHLLVSEPGQA